MAMKIQIVVFWVLTPCNDIAAYESFRGGHAAYIFRMKTEEAKSFWVLVSYITTRRHNLEQQITKLFFSSDTTASAHVQELVSGINVKVLTGSTQRQEVDPCSWHHCYLTQSGQEMTSEDRDLQDSQFLSPLTNTDHGPSYVW
jgi:diadenosine tetraphosphate (Ap4A) HIT family hydrolase